MPNKQRSRGRRTRSEAAQTRTRILERAERLFARDGYRGVTLRRLAEAAGVRAFTVQHHFGSKLGLYQTILQRWDADVEALLARVLAEQRDPPALVERIVDELFDFFVRHRARVALSARASLGEGLRRELSRSGRGWVRFIDATRQAHRLGGGGLDPRLLLITIEGVLNNHALSALYRALFDREVTDPALLRRTKAHLGQVILAILAPPATAGARRRRA